MKKINLRSTRFLALSSKLLIFSIRKRIFVACNRVVRVKNNYQMLNKHHSTLKMDNSACIATFTYCQEYQNWNGSFPNIHCKEVILSFKWSSIWHELQLTVFIEWSISNIKISTNCSLQFSFESYFLTTMLWMKLFS